MKKYAFRERKKKKKKCSLKVTCLTVSQNISCIYHDLGFPGGVIGKEFAYTSRRHKRAGLIFRSGRSPGEGNGNPPQYSCLEIPMDRGAWWATVHGAAKSLT